MTTKLSHPSGSRGIAPGHVEPDPIDIHVGARVRDLRVRRGFNQSDLGRALGLTFQQVQKYEKGANRISCSKLVGIANYLGVKPAYFFEAITKVEGGASAPPPRTLPPRLVVALQDMPDRFMGSIVTIAEALARPQ